MRNLDDVIQGLIDWTKNKDIDEEYSRVIIALKTLSEARKNTSEVEKNLVEIEKEKGEISKNLVEIEKERIEISKILVEIEKDKIEIEKINSQKIAPEAILAVLANLIGILLIMNHERLNVISTKAINFIGRKLF